MTSPSSSIRRASSTTGRSGPSVVRVQTGLTISRPLGERHRRHRPLARDDVEQEARRALAGLVHVDMRVFAIADVEDVRLQHQRREVAVEVEADADRHAGGRIRRMRTMISPSPSGWSSTTSAPWSASSSPSTGTGGAEALLHLADQRVEGRAGDGAARGRIGGEKRDRLSAGLGQHREEARHLGPGVAVAREHLVAAVEVVALEGLRPSSAAGRSCCSPASTRRWRSLAACRASRHAGRQIFRPSEAGERSLSADSVSSMTASSCRVEMNHAPRSSTRTPRSSSAVVSLHVAGAIGGEDVAVVARRRPQTETDVEDLREAGDGRGDAGLGEGVRDAVHQPRALPVRASRTCPAPSAP